VTPGADILERLDALRVWPYPHRVLVVIGAAWFFAFFDVVNIGYALPAISDQFGVSSTMAALAVTIGLVGYIVGSLSDGLVADRFGRRPALIISVAAFSVGTIIAALAPDLSVLLVGRFIAGMGIGAEIAAATAYVGEIAPASLRGRAGCIAAAFGYVGFAVVPFVALAIVPRFEAGWRVLFLIGAVGALVVLPFRRQLPLSPRWLVSRGRLAEAEIAVAACEAHGAAAGRTERAPEAHPPTRPARGAPGFVRYAALFLAVWFAYYIGNYAWLTLAPTLLTQEGFSLSESIGFLSVTGVGFVVGALVAVLVGERIERKFTITATLVLWAVTLLSIGVAPVAGVIMMLGFVASATIGLAVPLMYVYTAEHFTSARRARGVSIADGIGHIGGAIAPYVVLPVAGISFGLGLGVMALTGLVSAALVLLGRRMTGRAVT